MDISEKQAKWRQERPLFEAVLIHSHLLPFFNFNENTGDYEIKVESVANTDDEDRKVAYETLNTGWVMWLRAKRNTKASAVPVVVSDIQSWIAVKSFSALDVVHENTPIIDANELAKYIDSLNLNISVPEGFVLIDNSELESLKSDNEHLAKFYIDWTSRAYKQRAKVEHIKNEVERFKQSGTHLDLSRFLDNLIEFSTFKHDEDFEGFVLVPKADLESWHLWDGDSENMYRDHYSESICDDVELGAVFEIDAKMAFKVDPIYVVPIYSDSDDFEYEEFESEELANKAAAENKAMIEAQEQGHE